MRWWWLSFGSEVTGKWLGGCWIEATSGIEAVEISHRRGFNPGGQVKMSALAEDDDPPPMEQRDRLLQKEDFEHEKF